MTTPDPLATTLQGYFNRKAAESRALMGRPEADEEPIALNDGDALTSILTTALSDTVRGTKIKEH